MAAQVASTTTDVLAACSQARIQCSIGSSDLRDYDLPRRAFRIRSWPPRAADRSTA